MMPHVRKNLYNLIAEKMKSEAQDAQMELDRNKTEMKRLHKRQKTLKEKASEAWRLYNEFINKDEPVKRSKLP